MDLDQMLSEHEPPVATRNHELGAALVEVCDRVTSGRVTPLARRRPRRSRMVLTGLATATLVGVGGVAAADLPWRFPWDSGTDVKTFRTHDGVECEMAFTVSAGVDTGGDMAKARRVARRELHRFELDPGLLPTITHADLDDEALAFLHAAAETVNEALADEGLPSVNVQAETVCTQDGR